MSSNRVIDPRAAERRRSILITIAAVMALVVIAAGVIIWAVGRGEGGSGTNSSGGGTAVPTVTTDNGAIRLTGAAPGATPPVVVTVTEDFQCPACKSFEQTMGPALAAYHDNPDVAVDYVAINMLDQASSTRYSTRAANAAMCVAEKTGKEGDFATWMEYHNLLSANQPAEGGSGLPDSELISLAEDAGAGDISGCVDNMDYDQWITENSQKAMSEPGFQGTPSVRINGEVVQLQDAAALQAQVNAAVEAAK